MLLVVEILDPFFIDLSDSGMDVEFSRPGGNFVEKVTENVLRDPCGRSPQSRLMNSCDLLLVLAEFVELVRENLLVVSFIGLSELVFDGFKASNINNSLFDQFLRVKFKDIWSVLNLFIHERLCEVWLILLVMAVSPVANNINEDVLLELLSVLNCDLHALVKDVRLITIHMDHWSIDCLGNFSAVIRRSAAVRICGKADLVI
jgi:hypothetical protein